MEYRSFLIKYAEIGTKGKNRYLFEDALIKQMKRALKNVDGQFVITKESGRIYVETEGEYDYDDAVDALRRVFGIVWICPWSSLRTRTMKTSKSRWWPTWTRSTPTRTSPSK